MIGIYKFTNKITGESYIGQSKNIERRYREHKYLCGQKTFFHKMLKFYGIDNFDFEVIEECSIEELNEKEIFYIEQCKTQYPNGYNISSGGWNHSLQFFKLKSYTDVLDIIELLKSNELTNTEISKMYDVTPQFISQINMGYSWKQENISYPIRDAKLLADEKMKNNIKYYCECCGSELSGKNKKMCLDCYKKQISKHIPTKDVLYNLLMKHSFLYVGKLYGVSDNAVRKWCDKYNIPRHSSYYQNVA